MKIPSKSELQQITINHSSDIDLKDFINLYKGCTAKPYSFLVNDTTLGSDNSLRFRCNLLKRTKKLTVTIDDKIRDEKLQYDINREAAKILVLSPNKIDKYEYITGEETLPSDQSRMIKNLKFTYLGKDKTIEDQGRKQIDAIMNKKRQVRIINNDHNLSLKEKERKDFYKCVKERLIEITFR